MAFFKTPRGVNEGQRKKMKLEGRGTKIEHERYPIKNVK
jgi:hypothetical protein